MQTAYQPTVGTNGINNRSSQLAYSRYTEKELTAKSRNIWKKNE